MSQTKLCMSCPDKTLLKLLQDERDRDGVSMSDVISKYVHLGLEAGKSEESDSPEPVELVPGMTFYP